MRRPLFPARVRLLSVPAEFDIARARCLREDRSLDRAAFAAARAIRTSSPELQRRGGTIDSLNRASPARIAQALIASPCAPRKRAIEPRRPRSKPPHRRLRSARCVFVLPCEHLPPAGLPPQTAEILHNTANSASHDPRKGDYRHIHGWPACEGYPRRDSPSVPGSGSPEGSPAGECFGALRCDVPALPPSVQDSSTSWPCIQ